MSFCEFCSYDVPGPCDSARLAARCQSLHSTREFCGHDVHLPCDDAETAERCRLQYIMWREERLSGQGTGLR
jgi:hypothetical protein